MELLPPISDHSPVFIKAYFCVQKAQAKPRCIPVYKKANWNKIKSDMDKLNEHIQQAACKEQM